MRNEIGQQGCTFAFYVFSPIKDKTLGLFIALNIYIYIYIYMCVCVCVCACAPYPCRVELSSEWSNCVAISVYARLFIWIELPVAVKRIYVNNKNLIHKYLNLLRWRWIPRGWVVESWIGVWVSFGNLATLMSSYRTKQIFLWMTIYICVFFIKLVANIEIYIL